MGDIINFLNSNKEAINTEWGYEYVKNHCKAIIGKEDEGYKTNLQMMPYNDLLITEVSVQFSFVCHLLVCIFHSESFQYYRMITETKHTAVAWNAPWGSSITPSNRTTTTIMCLFTKMMSQSSQF